MWQYYHSKRTQVHLTNISISPGVGTMTQQVDRRRAGRHPWTLLTNHGTTLIFIADHPDSTVREVADWVGISERSAARILSDLRSAGYVEATRYGRRNSYRIDLNRRLRHPATADRSLEDLLRGFFDDPQEVAGNLSWPLRQSRAPERARGAREADAHGGPRPGRGSGA
jgi:hypothetical protein